MRIERMICVAGNFLLMAASVIVVAVLSAKVSGQTTAFSYQGVLSSGGVPANGAFDLSFSLYDGLNGGNQVGSSLFREDVTVSNGIFSVTLDFGAGVFDGNDRYLGIGVRAGESSGGYTQLSPRVPLNSVPYAVMSLRAASLASTLSIAGGGTGATTAGEARSSLGAAARGANSDITSLSGLTTPLSVSQGGTGVGVGPTVEGQYLRAAAAGTWAIGNIAAGDIPNLSGSYVDLTSTQTISGNKTFTGMVSGGGIFNWQVVTSSLIASPNRGYIADGAAPVTITLPTTPNAGDFIRISGLGSGGWRVAAGTGQSLTTYLTSLQSLAASPTESWNATANWVGVASSADGTKLVALVWGGRIYTSTDAGATWTARESNRNWIAAASSADGTKLVALVNAGQIYTSTDSGVTWVPRESNRNWESVASSADGTKLVAVESGQIYTSTDSGETWVARVSRGGLKSVASSADGTKLVAVVNNGQIYTSTDSGVTWTSRESDRGWQSVASSADGTKLVAVADLRQIYLSTDSGETWVARESSRVWQAVTSSADGTKLAAAVWKGQIYTSTDAGAAWTARAGDRVWRSVASSADGTRLVAAAYGDQLYNSSDSGMTWTPFRNSNGYQVPRGVLTGDASSSIEIVFIGGGRFLIVAATGSFTVN